MARITPQNNNPLLSFRFKIIFSELEDIGIYARSIELPTIDQGAIVMENGNTQMKVKGKTKWNDIQMTCYAVEKKTMRQFWKYLNELHQKVEDGTDYFAEEYKKDIQIQLLRPNDEVQSTWKLVGAFINVMNFGQMDYTTEEIVQPQITISYDYALFVDTDSFAFSPI